METLFSVTSRPLPSPVKTKSLLILKVVKSISTLYIMVLLQFTAYCIVAKDTVGKQISIAFLERVREDFKKRYGGGKADTAVAKSLNKEFGPIMKEHMQYIIDHAEEIDKLLKVKAQVSAVKTVMMENIDKALGRGEVLTVLNDKAETLRDSAQEYKKRGDQIRRKMWYQNMKIKLVVLGVLLVLALIIWLSICHGFNCAN